MCKVIISTESSSDIPYKIRIPYEIQVIPIHVNFGLKTYTDGEFSPEEVFNYYKANKKAPTTSAVNPDEYVRHFQSVFSRYPDCKIIHISYSSSLSVMYQNAVIASSEFDPDKICIIDSKNVSGGVGTLVTKAAELARKYSDKLTFDEIISLIVRYSKLLRCVYVPSTLDYLRAGGRISGLQHLGASVLNLKPSLTVSDGQLLAGKKYRGDIYAIAEKLLDDFVANNSLDRSFLVINYSQGFGINGLFALKRKAHKLNFKKSWCFQIGAAISVHSGPACIGFAGLEK